MRSNAARWRPGHEQSMLTPDYILEPIRDAMGGTIDLDPCTEPDNPTGAVTFYALPRNGLALPWAGSVFCNPPYGDARRPWIRKCLELGQAGSARIALLIPADPDTELGQAVIAGAEAVTFVAGRIRYGYGPRSEAHPDKPWRASHASMIATWGVDLAHSGLGVTVTSSRVPSLV